MSLMLSLPDDWNYTVEGLTKICKESNTAIESALKELKDNDYLIVAKKYPNETESGRIEYEYILCEQKQGFEIQGLEKQGVENQPLEILGVENRPQLNNNILNTNKQNNNILNTKSNQPDKKQKLGYYGRVVLTGKQLEKLKQDYGEEFVLKAIDRLDEYVQSNNNKNHYTDFNLVLRKAIREGWSMLADIQGNPEPTKQPKPQYAQPKKYEMQRSEEDMRQQGVDEIFIWGQEEMDRIIAENKM